MIIANKLKELESARAKLAKLEESVTAQLHSELAALPGKFGFESAEDFMAAFQQATGGVGGHANGQPVAKRRGRPAGSKNKNKSATASAKPAAKKTRTRAKITDETRAMVKKLVENGKTGGEIAGELGISLPSVQNIKKALGLVKAR